MTFSKPLLALCVPALLLLAAPQAIGQKKFNSPPTLHKQGTAAQLIVEDKPFLVLGGETGNSSGSDIRYMKPVWKAVKAMNLNTVLVPIYWELLEPEKGRFDFSLLDSLINDARHHDLKLALLWFGSWKNSMSCYVPGWIKKDYKTYPRAYDKNGMAQEILTPFSPNNLQADIAAFSALMKHIKEKDENNHTVIMIQVENEIGMLPDARDYHPQATREFNSEVPKELISYIQKNKKTLAPALLKTWESAGSKTTGNWEAVFGKSLATDEIFVAWNFAKYTNRVTEEGKKIYPLPMFVNAALNRPNAKPGDYPSGGPLPHIIDVWKVAAPAIDFLSPDFYNPDFKHWNDLYKRNDNPLFIPEIRFDSSVYAKVFYAIGHYHAMGFSPFSIESAANPEHQPLAQSYNVLAQLSGLITTHQGKSSLDGSLVDKTFSADTLTFGQYRFIVRHDYTLGWSPDAKKESWPHGGVAVIQVGTDEFMVAGTGVVITFSSATDNSRVGILTIEEGTCNNGKWTPGRVLNGDQSHQGRHLRFPAGHTGIQRLVLYKYK